MSELPASAKIIVIGGGIVGCSVAYHLAKRGLETLVLERHQLTSGSTWHAAGLVGQLRTSANITKLLGYSVERYDKLEAETGYGTGWKRNGGLRLACNEDRWIEVKRQATTARSFGLDMHLLSRRVFRADQEIELQPREFRLLEYLMQHVDQVVTRTMLLEQVWDYRFDPHTSLIDTHISRLRKKIDEGQATPLLHTLRGTGYRLSEKP